MRVLHGEKFGVIFPNYKVCLLSVSKGLSGRMHLAWKQQPHTIQPCNRAIIV